MSVTEFAVDVQYVDRVKHVHSLLHTSDEEVAYAESITDRAELIEVHSSDDDTEVVVSTEQGVYHFTKLRSQYVGHAPRGLVQVLEHFGMRITLQFITAHRTFSVYFSGEKIVANDKEYHIASRDGIYELVEPIQWLISSEILDIILQWSDSYGITPVEVVEQTVRLLDDFNLGRDGESAE